MAGRKPIDAIVLFRMLILQSLYNLSDEQVEYQVRDRLSFTRFLTSGIEDCIPDGTTLWLFREKLAQAGIIERLFDCFDQHSRRMAISLAAVRSSMPPSCRCPDNGTRARKTKQSRVAEPPRRGRRNRPRTGRRIRSRWTKKHGRSFYGYKNHVNADARYKLIRRYDVSDAAVHDSQKLDGLLNKANTSADVFADSAYRSAETEVGLKARGFRSRIHVRATRIIRSRSGSRKRTERRAASELASSMCSEHRRLQPEAGSCVRSASSEHKRRLDCRTSCTIFAVS